MTGVMVGTRLDQLLDLRDRVEVAIKLERREIARGNRPTHGRVTSEATPAPPRPTSSPESPVTVPLSAVRPALVRDWAETQGIATPGHGPLTREVVAAFVEAHR